MPEIKSFLLDHGFNFKEDSEILFFKDEDNRLLKLNFYFSISGLSGNTLFHIAFKEVEGIINTIGLPNWKSRDGINAFYSLSTIIDKETVYAFTDRPIRLGQKLRDERASIRSEKDLMRWKEAFFDYFNGTGKIFLRDYSSLIDLQEEIINLESRDEKNYSSLFIGGVDHLFRVLIISKLCNDPGFSIRQDRFDRIILQDKYANWHPYYRKLKEMLLEIEPIYNV